MPTVRAPLSSVDWLVRSAALFVAVELAALQVLTHNGQTSLAMASVALVVDLVLFGVVAHRTFVAPHGGLRALPLSPRHALAGLVLALFAHRLVATLLSVPSLAVDGSITLAALELSFGVATLVLALRTARAHGAAPARPLSEALEAALSTLFSPALASLLVAEARIVVAACATVMHRPRANRPGFTLLETSGYRSFVVAMFVLTLVEAPAAHVLIHACAGKHAAVLHVSLLALTIYSLLWLAGDLRLLREGRHALTPEGLSLELGVRARGLVPYDAIAALGATPPEGLSHVRLSALDTPNVVLVLHREVELSLLFGRKKRTRCIALYLDDPAGFVRELERRR